MIYFGALWSTPTLDSFEELLKSYSAMVRRIVNAYERESGHVDDLVQEVWLAIWRAMPAFKNQSSLRTYIARIAQNVSVTHVRKSLRFKPSPLVDEYFDPKPSVGEADEHATDLLRLVEAVQSLPISLKEVATLYLENMPIQEIAAALSITENTASVRLVRAKAALKRTIRGDR